MSITRRQTAAGLLAAGLLGRAARAADAPSPATAALPRTYAGTTLNLLWGPETVFKAIADFSAEFTTATGIALNYTNVSYGDRFAKMTLDTASRTNAFDIYLNAYQWKEGLAPFVIDHANIDKEVKGAPPLDLDDYPQRALEVYSKVGDKVVALPINGSATFLVWNKKAYRAAGLDPDTAPNGWDVVAANGQKLVGDKQYGFNQPAGKSIQAACLWITLFHGYGGTFTDASGQPAFNSPAGVRAVETMAGPLQKISPPGNLTWDFPEMVNSMALGQSAQGFMWPGGFSTLMDPAKSAVAGELGWAPTPGAVMLGGWAVSVNSSAKALDAAKLYVAWVTSKDVARRLALITAQPARTSAFQDPAVVARYPQLPAILQGMSGRVAAYMPIRDSEQVNILIYDEVNAACAGTKTPQQAADDMQGKVLAFMKRRGYVRG